MNSQRQWTWLSALEMLEGLINELLTFFRHLLRLLSSRYTPIRDPQAMASQRNPIILVTYANARTQREVELERSEIKPHAALVTHKRRRQSKSSAPPSRVQSHRHEQTRDATCSLPKISRGWEKGSLTRRDPFASHPGHNVPIVCHEALDGGNFCVPCK